MQRLCFSLDLRPDPVLITEYIRLHQDVWPEIRRSIYEAGIKHMQIYYLGSRLFMIIDAEDDFSLERKARMDSANPKVMAWERLMENFQQVSQGGELTKKWQPMQKIFQLTPP